MTVRVPMSQYFLLTVYSMAPVHETLLLITSLLQLIVGLHFPLLFRWLNHATKSNIIEMVHERGRDLA